MAAAGLVVLIAPLVFAHAVLVKSTPAANQSVTGPDVDVQLQFNCRIDSVRSSLTLSLSGHGTRTLSLRQSTPATLTSRIVGLAEGEYRLQWQVLAADGHITRGEVPFRVQ